MRPVVELVAAHPRQRHARPVVGVEHQPGAVEADPVQRRAERVRDAGARAPAVAAAPHVLHADLRQRPVDHPLHRPAAGAGRNAGGGCRVRRAGGRAARALGRVPPGGLLTRRLLRRQLPLPGPEPVALGVQAGVAGLGRVQLRLHRGPLRVDGRPAPGRAPARRRRQRPARRPTSAWPRAAALCRASASARAARAADSALARSTRARSSPSRAASSERATMSLYSARATRSAGSWAPGEQPERARVEALLVGRGDEVVHPGPGVVDGRARGLGGHPGLLRAPGRLGGRGLRGGQVVQRGRRVLPPGGQVGLQVVGPGVELGQARRELPDLGGAGAHLRPAAVQRTVAGVGRRWRGQSGAVPASRAPTTSAASSTVRRTSPPPVGRPGGRR